MQRITGNLCLGLKQSSCNACLLYLEMQEQEASRVSFLPPRVWLPQVLLGSCLVEAEPKPTQSSLWPKGEGLCHGHPRDSSHRFPANHHLDPAAVDSVTLVSPRPSREITSCLVHCPFSAKPVSLSYRCPADSLRAMSPKPTSSTSRSSTLQTVPSRSQ